jgi:hypothetical protein
MNVKDDLNRKNPRYLWDGMYGLGWRDNGGVKGKLRCVRFLLTDPV